MGVTSTIIDDRAFLSLLDDLAKSVKLGYYLITKDSLNDSTGDRAILSGKYITKYRDEKNYEGAIELRKFALINKITLAKSDWLINHLYLWKKG